MYRKISKALLLLLCLISPRVLWALATDKEQPIAIEADSLDIDDKEGISTYRGNVRVTQGTILVLAEVVTVYSKERELQQVVAVGTPASFRQEVEGEDGEIRAQGDVVNYYPATDRIVLSGGAHLWRGKNEFLGNRIEYDSLQDIVKASAAESGEQRVKVIIQPESANGQETRKKAAEGVPSP